MLRLQKFLPCPVVLLILLFAFLFIPIHQAQAAPNVCAQGCIAVAGLELIGCAEGCAFAGPAAPECFTACSIPVGVRLGVCLYGCGVFSGNSITVPHPTGNSPFELIPGTTEVIAFGQLDTLGTFQHGAGDVVASAISLLNLDELTVPLTDTTNFANLPWSVPGLAMFDGDSSWTIPINFPNTPNQKGYLVRCDMYKAQGGDPVTGFTVIRPIAEVTGVGPNGNSRGVHFSTSPNPAPSQSTLSFNLPTEGPAQIEIYDLLGRRLRNWAWSVMPAGDHRITWDGRDDAGELVSSAIVFARLKINNTTYTTRIVRTK